MTHHGVRGFWILVATAAVFACTRRGGSPPNDTALRTVRDSTSRTTRSASGPPEQRSGPAAGPATGDSTHAGATRVEMRNVGFHLDDQIVMHITRLEGRMRPKRSGTPIVFDDKSSFIIHIDRAQVALSARDLSLLLNRYVFGYHGSPLHNLNIKTSGSRIIQTGTLHKGVDMPFTITAEISATPDGHIRLHPVETRIFNVDGDALMRALHLTLEKLIDLKGATGASVKGNDIYLAPDSILPPPTIEGHLSGIRVQGSEIVQTFGPADSASGGVRAALAPPDRGAKNYMYYHGGTLRFGKLMMLDADMQIIDRDTTDLFDFDIDHYQVQLVAGYSRTLPDGGLEVFMPDFDDAQRTLTAARTDPAPGTTR